MIDQFKPLLKQIAVFGTAGVIATLVHVVVGVSLNSLFGFSSLWANLIAIPIATCVTLFSNSRITFRGHRGGKTSFAKGLMTVLFGLGLNQFIVLIVTDYAELPYEAALVVVIAIVPAVTFLLFKFWEFRS